jgi:hypothetical protein
MKQRSVVSPDASPGSPSRRQFLKQGAGVIVGTLVFSSGPIALLAPSRTWALELSTLDEATGRALLRLARHLFPHDRMEDAVYAMVVKALDKDASDAGAKQFLADGVASLDRAAGGSWMAADPERQLVAVKAIEGSPFFGKVRGTCVTALYDNPLAYAHFGYEGSSWEHGGYLERGFNDLKWLPNPPADASPPLARRTS